MRLPLLFTVIIVTAAFSRIVAAERPREFVERFCQAENSWAIQGLPGKLHEPLYDAYLGVELIRAIRSANSRLELGKPTPWSQGKFHDAAYGIEPIYRIQ